MAYRVAALLSEEDSPAIVHGWFQGMSLRFDDVVPARRLCEGDLDQMGPEVLAAACVCCRRVSRWWLRRSSCSSASGRPSDGQVRFRIGFRTQRGTERDQQSG